MTIKIGTEITYRKHGIVCTGTVRQIINPDIGYYLTTNGFTVYARDLVTVNGELTEAEADYQRERRLKHGVPYARA